MRKKFPFVILAALMCMPVFADVVGRDEAMRAAKTFFAARNAGSVKELSLVAEGFGSGRFSEFEALDFVKKAKCVAAPDPSYYVFNNPDGGWVIIAGDNSVSPVLAYSTEGSFSYRNMPDNLQWWMDMLDAQVLEHRNSGGAKPALWSASLTGGTPVLELETASWNQGEPYNWETPSVQGQSTYTGCVATASAIVCRYHQWPPYGKGTVDGYKTRTLGIKIPQNTLGRAYDYRKMPLTYDRQPNREQGNAVAALMYDLGTALEMDYTPQGSGAYPSDLPVALSEHFGYQSSARCLWRDNYSDKDWLALIKRELEENGPVLYGGYTEDNSGHQFIFDGYDSQDFFRVNWGWGGHSNGYFKITALGNRSSGVYSSAQHAVLYLKPDYTAFTMTPDMIADATSLTYNRDTKELLVNCKIGKDINYSLASFDGIVVKSGATGKGNPIKIDVSAMKKGTYTLTLWEEAPYVLTLEL